VCKSDRSSHRLAIAEVLMAEGMEANVAKQQAEKAVILVQGQGERI
jgi:hypothetical protein